MPGSVASETTDLPVNDCYSPNHYYRVPYLPKCMGPVGPIHRLTNLREEKVLLEPSTPYDPLPSYVALASSVLLSSRQLEK
jgi:hypothetical protein